MRQTRKWLAFFALATLFLFPLNLWLLDPEVLGQFQAGPSRRPALPLQVRVRATPPPPQEAHRPAQEEAPAPISVFAEGLDEDTLQAVRRWARYYQVDIGFALCVARHESGFHRFAVGDGGEAVGLYQFWLPTWRMLREKMGLPTADRRFDVEEAVKTACWAFAHGYRSYWAVVKKGLCP